MRNKNRSRNILIGVTGGIGSGKTEVCKVLKRLGCSIYCADDIAKQLYRTNAALKTRLLKAFGTKVLDSKKDISLLSLRNILFRSKVNQRRVGGIVHPFVVSEIIKRVKGNRSRYVVIEAALIFETNFDRFLDYTIMVHSKIRKRIRRLLKRNNLPVREIRRIMSFQMSEREKMKRADKIISNDKSLNELRKKVKLTFVKLSKTFEHDCG